MNSFYKFKHVLIPSWSSYRFIFCQKVVEIQFIRRILSCDIKSSHLRTCFYSTTLRIGDENNQLINKYAAVFGDNNEKVKSILKSKQNIIKNDDDIKRLEEILQFLTSVNVSPESEKDLEDILSLRQRHTTASVIEERYHCLKEMGFTNISIETLFCRYNSLMNTPVISLHSNGELAYNVHPMDLLISTIEAPTNLADIINTKHKTLRSGSICSMHHAVMLEFLVWRLNSSHQKILNLIKKYPCIRSHSFHSVKEMLKILIEDIGFSEEKIVSNGFLLPLNSKKVSRLLEALSGLLNNISIPEFIKTFPMILTVQFESFKKIEKLFQQYDITSEHVKKKGSTLTIHPDTISERLKFLEDTLELKKMKSNPSYLCLVYSFNKVVKRLEYLKKHELPVTFNVLCGSEGRFQHYISSSEDCLLHSKIERHLAIWLKVNKADVHDKMSKSYIDAKLTPTDEKITERINFLKQNNVPTKVILNNLSVLLVSEEFLLRNIRNKTFVGSQSKINAENHSKEDVQNDVLQLMLDIMIRRPKYGRRIMDEFVDVNEFLLEHKK